MNKEKRLAEINKAKSFWLGPWIIWLNIQKHKFLISNFIQRDLRLKYRNSVLGYEAFTES